MLKLKFIYIASFLLILTNCTKEVVPEPLNADYSIVTPEAYFGHVGEINRPINFINNSKGASKFHWIFDDGSESFDKNPMHKFSLPGFYEVQLTVSNDSKSSTITKNLKIGQRQLKEVLIEKISFLNQFNNSWDPDSGPDVILLISETGNPDNSLVLSTIDNLSISDLPFGGKITFDDPVNFIQEKWTLTLIENNLPMNYIDENDNFMFSSTFNPVFDGESNLENENGSISIDYGQDASGNFSSDYKVTLYWELEYH